jgi:hypothetical protein
VWLGWDYAEGGKVAVILHQETFQFERSFADRSNQEHNPATAHANPKTHPNMSSTSPACQFFEHLAEYRVAVCRECRYAVWPDQIAGHLQKQHKKPRREAEAVGESIRSWPGLIQYPSELDAPSSVVQPVPQLPVYADGLLCQLDPGRCQLVFRSNKALKEYWRKAHAGWSAGKKRGRPSQARGKAIQAQMEEGCRRVYCQQLFGSRHRSQYFEVQSAPEDGPQPAPTEGEAAWARVGEAMGKAWAGVEERVQNTIQEGSQDEDNPWLKRTGWEPYLKDLSRPELLACIEEPNSDPDKDEEPVEAAIWNAMAGLARFSQTSVVKRIGIFVRLEAIRTEKQQTQFKPLEAYMDNASVGKHTRPWQQMLMFFARRESTSGRVRSTA